tara:strand:+ start:81 stop:998 length:918 start_codon:yes stop_codon:yes gene_type:complete
MAVVKSGIFSNPGTGFSTSNRKTNQSPNGARGGASDADFAFVNGKPNNGLAATTSIDPSATRLANAKLGAGGGSWGQQSSSTVADAFGDAVVSWGGAGSGGGAEVPGGNNGDWRVRISVSPSAKILYRAGGDVMYPLLTTDGVIFPHLPTLQISNSAKYNSTQLTHNNYTNYFYQSSEASAISISGEFSAQTSTEADYVLATIHFFRSSTKMFFGDSGEFQGSPPPIVYLDGYGKYYLPHVPCLVTNFSHTMTPDVDYIAANNGQRIPTLSNIQVSLQPVYSRVRQLEFNFDKFAAGQQLDKGFI